MKICDQITQVESELKSLVYINSHRSRRMHYSTVFDIISDSGLPYKLVQHSFDSTGKFIRGYLYNWTSDYDSTASLFIQETKAGCFLFRSMGAAIDALRLVLQDHLRSLKYL